MPFNRIMLFYLQKNLKMQDRKKRVVTYLHIDSLKSTDRYALITLSLKVLFFVLSVLIPVIQYDSTRDEIVWLNG